MKSKIVECFQFEVAKMDYQSIVLVDIGFMWHISCPSKEAREILDCEKLTWGDYAEHLFNLIIERHPNASEIHLLRTDMISII